MNTEDLIIERPKSQSATQRWTSTGLTTVAWVLLFYGFFPIVGFIISRRALPELPFEHNITSMAAWGSLLPLLPWWALSAVVMIGALYVWATVQFFRFRKSRRNGQTAHVTTAEMAKHCDHPEADVKEWGAARRTVAHYDDKSKMTSVSTSLSEPFREIPREDEPPAPTAPLAQPTTPRECADQRQDLLTNKSEILRAEMVKCWGQVSSLEAVMQDIAENRKDRDNNRDVVLYAELQAKHKVLLERIKVIRQQVAEARYLQEEYKRVMEDFSLE